MFVDLVVGVSEDLRCRVFVATGHMPSSEWRIGVNTRNLGEGERAHLIRMPRRSPSYFPLHGCFSAAALDDDADLYVSAYTLACSPCHIVSDVFLLPAEPCGDLERVAVGAYLRWCGAAEDGPSVDDAIRALIQIDERGQDEVCTRVQALLVDHVRARLDSLDDPLLAAFVRRALGRAL